MVNHENTRDNMKILLSEQSEVKEKVNLLEAVVQKMFLEKIQLEAKAKNKKITIIDKEIIEEAIEEETDCKRKQKKTYGTDVKQNYKPPIVDKEFPNTMDALAHAAKDHSQNINEDTPRTNAPSEKPDVKDVENDKTFSK